MSAGMLRSVIAAPDSPRKWLVLLLVLLVLVAVCADV